MSNCDPTNDPSWGLEEARRHNSAYRVTWTGVEWIVTRSGALLERAETKGHGIEIAEKHAGRHLGWDFTNPDEALST